MRDTDIVDEAMLNVAENLLKHKEFRKALITCGYKPEVKRYDEGLRLTEKDKEYIHFVKLPRRGDMTDYEFAKYCVENKGRCGNRIDLDHGCGLGCVFVEGDCSYSGVYAKAKAWLENYEKETKMDGIKVTVEEKKVEKKSEYPCYKIQTRDVSKGAIVYFTSPRNGIVMVGTDSRPVGEDGDNWDESGSFTPFHGTITIEVE